MRLTMHTFICCCIFSAILPMVKGSTEELNGSLKKRLREWLQSHMKRDPTGVTHAAPLQDGKPASIPPSFAIHIRPRRSTGLKRGCVLFTCTYSDLLQKLLQESKHDLKEPVSKEKMNRYGRRRRSVPVLTQLDLTQFDLETEAGLQACRIKCTCVKATGQTETWQMM